MTWHQYEMAKWLQRVWRLKQLFDRSGDGTVTKQAEIELAGQAAAKNRPPIQGNDVALTERSWVMGKDSGDNFMAIMAECL